MFTCSTYMVFRGLGALLFAYVQTYRE